MLPLNNFPPHISRLIVPRRTVKSRLLKQQGKGRKLQEYLQTNNIYLIAELNAALDEYQKWHDFNHTLLLSSFDDTSFVREYHEVSGFYTSDMDSVRERQRDLIRTISSEITCLESIWGRLSLVPEIEAMATPLVTISTSASTPNRKVFVVHGHNVAIKESVARYLLELDLVPVILSEQPNKGRTIIEKFEQSSDVGFAVVLLTADDVGRPKEHKSALQPRARQNVILELGYFIGALKRQRVCALYERGVEVPSDFLGVVWVEIDDGNAWKQTLARELKAAGIDIDLNALAS